MKYDAFEEFYEKYPQFTYERLEKILNVKRKKNANANTTEEVISPIF